MDRDALKQLLGPFSIRCPLDAVCLETADSGLKIRETIEYAVEADERVKSFILVPKHINRTVPAIFAHHQRANQFHLGKSEVVGLEGDADQASSGRPDLTDDVAGVKHSNQRMTTSC